jgi:predicted histidine transporter YuiF (NhaC family)
MEYVIAATAEVPESVLMWQKIETIMVWLALLTLAAFIAIIVINVSMIMRRTRRQETVEELLPHKAVIAFVILTLLFIACLATLLVIKEKELSIHNPLTDLENTEPIEAQ